MPKVIDNYVLEDKIGSGQFGDVYKGYHQQTQQQVAIKVIKRDMIKGKFYQLLENEIKVLKTCNNQNIIKLYAIKKTANHYYLMLQYCNQGDMLAYVRKHPNIPQQQIIKYFCQIINGFQGLVKHRIMHRDFKLANILLHNGSIKIADFGFAKLLNSEDYATTMLGSPLNMAPEVLGGNKYNSKADIWSIGACIYEMLFGKPPYVAGNMVDLLKLIKTKPLTIPKTNEVLRDVLKKMLVVDPKRRISWNDLFSHRINTYLDYELRKQINLELIEDESLMLNTSKYYLKKNLIIDKPQDIHRNQDVNNYLLNVLQEKQKKKNFEIIEKDHKKYEQQNHSDLKLSKVYRRNSKRILHYRNIYAFLATVADQIMRNTHIEDNQIAAYVIVQKILSMIQWLKDIIEMKQCPMQGLQLWGKYINEPEFKQIKNYIYKQLQVFEVFNKSLQPIIKSNILKNHYQSDIKHLLINGITQDVYKKYINQYIKTITKQTINQMLKSKNIQPYLSIWKHIQQTLIAINVNNHFGIDTHQFNFKEFYQMYNTYTTKELLLKIEEILKDNQ